MPQLTVTADAVSGLAGEIAFPLLPSVKVTKSCNVVLGIPFGLIVCADADDDYVKLPTVLTDVTANDVGVSIRQEYEESNTIGGVPYKKAMTVGRKGYFRVQIEAAVTRHGAVHVRCIANGGNNQLGAVRGAADSTNTAILPNARFHKSATSGHAIVEIW